MIVENEITGEPVGDSQTAVTDEGECAQPPGYAAKVSGAGETDTFSPTRITTPLNGGTTQRGETSVFSRLSQTSRDGLGDSCERSKGDAERLLGSVPQGTAVTAQHGAPSPTNSPASLSSPAPAALNDDAQIAPRNDVVTSPDAVAGGIKTTCPSDIERDAFENWHDALFDVSARTAVKNRYGYPQNAHIQHSWRAWQAALAWVQSATTPPGSLASCRQSVKENTDATNNQGFDSPAPATTSQREALLPCPFCGGDAEITFLDNDEASLQGYYARCSKCSINDDCLFEDEIYATSAWNARAPDRNLLAALEQVCEALESIDGHGLARTSPMREEQLRQALTAAAPYRKLLSGGVRSMSEEVIRALYATGLRCRADRDGDCDCGKQYRIAGREHCFLDIIDYEKNPDKYGV